MKKLWPVALALPVFSISVYAEDEPSATTQVDAILAEKVKNAPAAKKWYVGGAVGLGILQGWNTDAVDHYYFTQGYTNTKSSIFDTKWYEGAIYIGYKLSDFQDIDLGFTMNNGDDTQREYTNINGDKITSSRGINFSALYVATLLRPVPRGGLYFKLGAHVSQFGIHKTVTGTPANLGSIAAGDQMLGDGTSTGVGSLLGFGFDFRAGKDGILRLELNHYYRLGGTSYEKHSLNAGL